MDNKINYTYRFTVFTATYNRAYVLRRAFESLRKQKFRDFEWVVVDDGSTDGTEELVKKLAQKASFPVRYFYQTHGHKKKAINRGVQEAQGELFVFLDSDDELTPNALERLDFHWANIPTEDKQEFCGIFGLCRYADGSLVGTTFPQDFMISNLNEILFRYKVRGDKSTVYRVDILKKYPFPENISGLVPEGTIWCAIARTYSSLFVNESFLMVHISQDSITPKERFGSFFQERAEGRMFCAAELLSNAIKEFFFSNYRRFGIEAIMYSRSFFHLNYKIKYSISSVWGILLVIALTPVGFLLYIADRCVSYFE